MKITVEIPDYMMKALYAYCYLHTEKPDPAAFVARIVEDKYREATPREYSTPGFDRQ